MENGVRSGRNRRRDPFGLRSPGCIRRTVKSMKMEDRRTCPACDSEFSGAMEFCPVCILRKALADGVESGESSVLRIYHQADNRTGAATTRAL